MQECEERHLTEILGLQHQVALTKQQVALMKQQLTNELQLQKAAATKEIADRQRIAERREYELERRLGELQFEKEMVAREMADRRQRSHDRERSLERRLVALEERCAPYRHQERELQTQAADQHEYEVDMEIQIAHRRVDDLQEVQHTMHERYLARERELQDQYATLQKHLQDQYKQREDLLDRRYTERDRVLECKYHAREDHLQASHAETVTQLKEYHDEREAQLEADFKARYDAVTAACVGKETQVNALHHEVEALRHSGKHLSSRHVEEFQKGMQQLQQEHRRRERALLEQWEAEKESSRQALLKECQQRADQRVQEVELNWKEQQQLLEERHTVEREELQRQIRHLQSETQHRGRVTKEQQAGELQTIRDLFATELQTAVRAQRETAAQELTDAQRELQRSHAAEQRKWQEEAAVEANRCRALQAAREDLVIRMDRETTRAKEDREKYAVRVRELEETIMKVNQQVVDSDANFTEIESKLRETLARMASREQQYQTHTRQLEAELVKRQTELLEYRHREDELQSNCQTLSQQLHELQGEEDASRFPLLGLEVSEASGNLTMSGTGTHKGEDSGARFGIRVLSAQGPAAQGGFLPDDVIQHVEVFHSVVIRHLHDFRALAERLRPSDTLTCSVLQKGRRTTKTLEAASAATDPYRHHTYKMSLQSDPGWVNRLHRGEA